MFFTQHKLWQAVLDKTIDLVVSDHSPAPQDLKCTDSGDFMRAWGGISSLQLGKNEGQAFVGACKKNLINVHVII